MSEPARIALRVLSLLLLWTGFWVALITGGALRLLTRPKGNGSRIIDLGRLRRS